MGFGSLFKKDKTETRNELLSKGLEFLDSGKNEKAMKCFDKAMPLLPEFASTVWHFKGITFTRLENAEDTKKIKKATKKKVTKKKATKKKPTKS